MQDFGQEKTLNESRQDGFRTQNYFTTNRIPFPRPTQSKLLTRRYRPNANPLIHDSTHQPPRPFFGIAHVDCQSHLQIRLLSKLPPSTLAAKKKYRKSANGNGG